VAWGVEESQTQIPINHDLVELLTQKILERLN
jgi:hypothetical protein